MNEHAAQDSQSIHDFQANTYVTYVPLDDFLLFVLPVVLPDFFLSLDEELFLSDLPARTSTLSTTVDQPGETL